MKDMEQNIAKELPYGIQDFVTIAEQNIYYVDKTMYIPELEKQARNLFCIRPRRFGKTLTLSMLENYYDMVRAICANGGLDDLVAHKGLGYGSTIDYLHIGGGKVFPTCLAPRKSNGFLSGDFCH